MHFNPQLYKVSIIQTKLFGPLDFELLSFHCILRDRRDSRAGDSHAGQLDAWTAHNLGPSFISIKLANIINWQLEMT